MYIYLVRHGESQGNLEQRFIGAHSSYGLTEVGIHQVERAAQVLSDFNIPDNSRIYVSPTVRTVETAEILSKHLSKFYFEEDRLTEIDLGKMEDMQKDEVQKKYVNVVRNFSEKPSLCEIPGGESIPDVQQRVLSFIYDQLDDGRDLILVCHDIVIRAFLVYAMNMSIDFIWSLSPDELALSSPAKFEYGDSDIPLGSVSVVKYENGEFEVEKIGCV